MSGPFGFLASNVHLALSMFLKNILSRSKDSINLHINDDLKRISRKIAS